MKKEINPVELDFLLRFPFTQNVTSPVDFISNIGWGAIKSLSGMEDFRNLVSTYKLLLKNCSLQKEYGKTHDDSKALGYVPLLIA